MKLEEIQQLQPELVERFTQILEHKQLSHAYLFTGSFVSFEMALLLAQSQFCEDLQGVWPCGKCRSCRLIAEEEFSDVKIVRQSTRSLRPTAFVRWFKIFLNQGLKEVGRSLSSKMRIRCIPMRPTLS